MGGVLEVLAHHFGEDPCCCPDPYPGHGGQDLGERVGIDHRENLVLNLGTLSTQLRELLGQAPDDLLRRSSTGDGHCLFGQGGEDLFGEPLGQPWCVFLQQRSHMPWSGGA